MVVSKSNFNNLIHQTFLNTNNPLKLTHTMQIYLQFSHIEASHCLKTWQDSHVELVHCPKYTRLSQKVKKKLYSHSKEANSLNRTFK